MLRSSRIAKGIKMEKWVWDKLDELAREKKVTRNKLVEALLKGYVVRKINQADHEEKGV